MDGSTDLFNNNLDTLWKVHKQRLVWESGPILLKVAESLQNDTIITINLTPTIGQVRQPHANHLFHDQFYWLSKDYCLNDPEYRTKIIVPLFVQACAKAGFNICSKGWEGRSNCLKFMCIRGRKHKPENRTSDRLFKTLRPMDGEEETCKFGFSVWWDPVHNRWKVAKKQAGCACHNGHIQLKHNELKLNLKNQGKDNVERAIKHIESEISAAATAAYIQEESGFGCDPKAISSFRRQRQLKSYQINLQEVFRMNDSDPPTASHHDYHPTAADRLLADLEADPSYSYVLMFGEYNTDLLTIRKRSKRSNGAIDVEDVNPSSLEDDVDSASIYADKV